MTASDDNAIDAIDATTVGTIDEMFASELLAFIDGDVAVNDTGEPVARDTDLLLTGMVDSLGVVMIVEWIERRLDVTIDPGDVVLEHFQSVAAMLTFLEG
ncbi:MAG: phosphopantetheine-binding protein [Ilumatobacter sp.]|uniref:phosphopantetheine-binding protein n=1 Tax=Ilumatobacter sp. TaxID=1967498 RepID=UPI00391AC07F